MPTSFTPGTVGAFVPLLPDAEPPDEDVPDEEDLEPPDFEPDDVEPEFASEPEPESVPGFEPEPTEPPPDC